MPPKQQQQQAAAKKKAPPAATNGAAQAAKPQADARVVQQLRVLETVGATKKDAGKADEQKYTPRTEGFIKEISGVLDFFNYSRADIANLVRRANYDDMQIQIAVANVLEEKGGHETTVWEEKKTKKQMKEEKKEKEEQDKKDQEEAERELERLRKIAEKREKRELAKGGSSVAQPSGSSAALPPDPAILFAGSKPSANDEGDSKGKEEWWTAGDGGYSKGNQQQQQWDDWDNNKDWKGSGNKDWEDWNAGAKKDENWEGEWQEAPARGKKDKAKAKAKAESGKGGGGGKKEDLTDMWDMPSTAAEAAAFSMDSFTLGDIRAFEKKQEEPAGNMRTVEEIERDQLGAGVMAGLPAPGTGKNRVEMLLGGQDPNAGADRSDRGRGRGEGAKGEKGRGRGAKGERGDRGDRPERPERRERPATEEGERERMERLDRSDDPRRQSIEEVGDNVTVKKHSSMGCAVITLKDTRVREAILLLGNETIISGIKVQMKPHTDKATGQDVPTDIFIAWGRQVEKTTPLSERDLLKHFEGKHNDLVQAWNAEQEAKNRESQAAQERERQKKLLEEQQRQHAELQQREDQRRLYEEELSRRRHAEDAQTLARRQLEEFKQGAFAGQDPRAAAARAAAGGVAAQPRGDASSAGLNPGAASYGGAGGAQGAQAQWNAAQAQQWMQYMQAQAGMQAQNWQQTMAARGNMQQVAAQQLAAQQMQQAQAAQAAQAQGGAAGQDYAAAARAQAAYAAHYAQAQQAAYLADAQRGQTASAYAATAQAPAGYGQAPQAMHGAAGGYNAAAAAAYGRGERI